MMYPCSVQPKLDGVRLLASRTGLNTRNGKVVLNDEFGGLGNTLAQILPDGVVLDGEMYKHGHKFEQVVSMFKRGDPTLEYHVYDVICTDNNTMTFVERNRILEKWVRACQKMMMQIKVVQTHTASDEADVYRLHTELVAAGYEGIMLRNNAGTYECGKRSCNLQKLKEFMTDEFVIIDVVEATGADKGTAVFVCRRHKNDNDNDDEKDKTKATNNKTKKTNKKSNNDEFRVRMRSSREERRAQWEDRDKLIGRMLTVQFQELSVKNSLPRFPVGICIARDEFE